jgi:uncharacterized membrane-anchored protein
MLRGKAKKDEKTKNLIDRLSPNDISVIFHQDLDEIAAMQLVEKKVKAVINAAPSISGKYPNQGPKILSDAGIPIIDHIGDHIFNQINENDLIEIINNELYVNHNFLSTVKFLNKEEIESKMQQADNNIQRVLDEFINNTLTFAQQEKKFILESPRLPKISCKMEGRHVLVVVRGKNYREDLKAIRPYIEETTPIMIGVDGGGDALLDFGYMPDMVIGDMDSVSDKCLRSCKEIVVHAYPDGRSPGMHRVKQLGLNFVTFSFPGTSEDIALILAYEHKAKLIITVGSHTNMIDFLEKGRKGMASTFLVRMKVGYKIIDAKGVSELYKNHIKPSYIAALFIAALFPIVLVTRMSPQIQQLFYLVKLRVQLFLGF